ncbi:hypothetical protein CHRY9293_02597 [Chryseobacterium potabilaquae]|uniref:Uncharacterized protein n=1 Tax=Chryseobacterium potabilaquae TaxID=2675057 RepID=A0A6N4XAB3_9FLAO|nr:hypothetical protein CHRY9293_02597 [Chryseobacterium potabilaquae]
MGSEKKKAKKIFFFEKMLAIKENCPIFALTKTKQAL